MSRRRAPRWAMILAGLLAVAFGGAVFFQPFASLSALVVMVVVGLVLLAVREFLTAGTASSPARSSASSSSPGSA